MVNEVLIFQFMLSVSWSISSTYVEFPESHLKQFFDLELPGICIFGTMFAFILCTWCWNIWKWRFDERNCNNSRSFDEKRTVAVVTVDAFLLVTHLIHVGSICFQRTPAVRWWFPFSNSRNRLYVRLTNMVIMVGWGLFSITYNDASKDCIDSPN